VIPLPPLASLSLLHLSAPAPYLNWPSWYYLQLPNAIWYGILLLLIVLFLFLPFPSRAVDTEGYDVDGEG
jgi:hypothetical protein